MSPKCKLIVAPNWKARLEEAHLGTINDVYDHSQGTIITKSGSTQVIRVILSAQAVGRDIYVKKYWFPTSRTRFRGMFRETFFGKSKARREFENLVRLRSWDIAAPEAVAYGEERRGGWLFRSFLISAGVPNAMGMDVFIHHVLPTLPGAERRRVKAEMIRSLASQTRRMHEKDFVHHDYFWRNILLREQQLNEFPIIDAHKGKCWRAGASSISRAIDLSALDAPAPWFLSRADRLRFLLEYRNEPKLSPATKELARQVLQLAAPMRQRQLERVRRTRAPESVPPT